MDYSNYVALSAAIDYFEDLGGFDGVHSYVQPLLDWAQDMICTELDTSGLDIPKSMTAPYMRVIGEIFIIEKYYRDHILLHNIFRTAHDYCSQLRRCGISHQIRAQRA